MYLAHGRGPVAPRRRTPFRGFRPHVANGKHAGHTGLQRVSSACIRHMLRAACEPGDDEALVVELHATRSEPIRFGLRADEKEQMTRGHHFVAIIVFTTNMNMRESGF